MNLESSPLADVFERYNTAKLTTVIDEDDEGMEIRRHFVFPDGSHEDQKTSKKFNIESDFDVSILSNTKLQKFKTVFISVLRWKWSMQSQRYFQKKIPSSY